MILPQQQQETNVQVPVLPQAIALSRGEFTLLKPSGEIVTEPFSKLSSSLEGAPLLCCFSPHIKKAELSPEIQILDVLELFAFVRPTKFCVPTIKGLSKIIGTGIPENPEEETIHLLKIMETLLSDLKNDPYRNKADPLLIAQVIGQRGKGWAWTPYICDALGEPYDPNIIPDSKAAMRVWKHLPEWSEEAPTQPAAHHPITGEEAVDKLDQLLHTKQENREDRPVQKDYARQMTHIFKPAQDEDETHVLVAEAGTGVGKTLGYLAPASVWAEKNEGSVWVSTYTKNLQRQIDQELHKLYPDEELRAHKTAVRKGRENYLCLLNLEEASAAALTSYDPQQAVAAGLMIRWAAATKDGDLTGTDFPGWLATLLGFQKSKGLADRRGECVYAACDHYHKCFIERAARKSQHARIVVANHALVMINAAISSSSDQMPSHYIFDEGHQLFDAADSAFAVHLSALETKDLRRWVLGPEGGKKGRARGLRKRIEDLVKGNAQAEGYLDSVEQTSRQLTAAGWTKRLSSGLPDGSFEKFFHALYHQVMARSNGREGPYSLETDIFPLNEDILELSIEIQKILRNLQMPLIRLAEFMRLRLENDTDGILSADERRRLDSLAQSLERRAHHMLAGWISTLDILQVGQTTGGFAEWFEITRIDGQAVDIGLYRHWLDPMRPFGASMKPHAKGVAITSATLTNQENWDSAKNMTGVEYLSRQPHVLSAKSPFNYNEQSKIFVINDVRKDDMSQVASAYESLFKASNGGALGIFTAIQRLRTVHKRIHDHLVNQDIDLYAQHIDEIDPGTLVDIFRDEENACLLGTDAIRDGVDVPGRSLRLIAFDRVPWPRPTILHKARRSEFGRKEYDDMITGLKLKQAYGRLIRTSQDKGVFVLLDSMLPSRLHSAFPEGVEIEKCGLSDAVKQIKEFLHDT